MHLLKYPCFLLFTLISTVPSVTLHSQPSPVLFGTIRDAESGKPLEGATIALSPSGSGTSAGVNGKYRLRVPGGQTDIEVRFVGYQSYDTTVWVTGELRLDISLIAKPVNYEEVTIEASAGRDFVSSVRMGEVFIDREQMNKLPKLLGEADPVRYLQLTPGVQSGSEGGIGFYVRGGSVDQNLVLYDNTLVYNPGHLLGFVSVFNPDLVSEVSFLKAGIPARFGGRLSSVVRVQPDRGRSDSLAVRGQVGLVASRVTVNRSLFNDRASFVFSARYATIDRIIKPMVLPFLKDGDNFLNASSYSFYDLNGGFSFRLGQKDHFHFSGLYGEDSYTMERNALSAEIDMNWGNLVTSGSWSHVFSERLVMNTSVSSTDYHFGLNGSQSDFSFGFLSAISDRNVKVRFNHSLEKHKLVYGVDFTRHLFTPNDIDVDAGDLVLRFLSIQPIRANTGALYAENEITISERFSVAAGLRYSFYAQTGPFTEYQYDASLTIEDSVVYSPAEVITFYHHPEPRISAMYKVSETSSLKASYMHMAQYVHLATSSAVSLPTDIWLPSTSDLRPQFGNQWSAGYFRSFPEQGYEASVEMYFKHSRNQLEFIRGVISSSLNMTLDDQIAIGKGRSYGAEFLLRKKTGRFTYWTGYAITRAVREFDQINDGRIYPAKYDRRHDLSVAGVYALNDMWNFSAVFVYVSGNAFTLPVARYVIQNNLVNQYDEVNNYRMPAYHRLDLSATREKTTRNGNKSIWDFSVYNIYNHANPFYIYFQTNGNLEDYSLEVKPMIVSLFPVVPTVSWRFEF